MSLTAIVYAVLALGGIGLLFGALLEVAGRKLAISEGDEKVDAVRAALPGVNCGACGYAGCDAFAQAVVAGEAPANGCKPGGNATAQAVAELMGTKAEKEAPQIAKVLCQGERGVSRDRYQYDGYKSCLMASGMAGGPKKCPYACVGLGDCVDVCAFDAIEVVNGLARVDDNKCTACGMCASICPRHSIQMHPKKSTVVVRCQNQDNGKLARDACLRACIACRRCEKACNYDAVHVNHGFAKIDPEKCVRCGDCVEVCPSNCITMDAEKKK